MKELRLLLITTLAISATTLASQCCEKNTGPQNSAKLQKILENINLASNSLNSYQARIIYLFRQPLFESQTLRTGDIYYERTEEASRLRIQFNTIKQDEEKPRENREVYFFDGVWLTQIDYRLKQVKKRQYAEQDKPVDAFELAKQNFPIIGFTRDQNLQEQFEIELLGDPNVPQSNNTYELKLDIPPDSSYAQEYKSIEMSVDSDTYLPTRIIAESTEEDIYDIRFEDAEINQPIAPEVFEVKIPAGFARPEVIPLDE